MHPANLGIGSPGDAWRAQSFMYDGWCYLPLDKMAASIRDKSPTPSSSPTVYAII